MFVVECLFDLVSTWLLGAIVDVRESVCNGESRLSCKLHAKMYKNITRYNMVSRDIFLTSFFKILCVIRLVV